MSELPLQVGADRQLFVDDHVIQDSDGVRRILHTPERRNTILRGDRPWDEASVAFMSILEDDGVYRGYYRCDHQDSSRAPNPRHTAYAESADGITWTKPSLGLVDFQGSKDNNLVWLGPGANLSAFVDTNPSALPEERYKAGGAGEPGRGGGAGRAGAVRPGAGVAGRGAVEDDAGRPDPDRRSVRLVQRGVLGTSGKAGT